MVLIRLWVIGLLFLGIGCENKNADSASVNSASGSCTSDIDCVTGDVCRVDGTCATPQCVAYAVGPLGTSNMTWPVYYCNELFNSSLLTWILPGLSGQIYPTMDIHGWGGSLAPSDLASIASTFTSKPCNVQNLNATFTDSNWDTWTLAYTNLGYCCLTTKDCPVTMPTCTYNSCACTASSCSGNTPVCNTTTGACTACNASSCSDNTPFCNTATGACSACATDCSANSEVCNTSTGACVQCLSSTDCLQFDGYAPFCSANQCVECLQDTDCGPGSANYQNCAGPNFCQSGDCTCE